MKTTRKPRVIEYSGELLSSNLHCNPPLINAREVDKNRLSVNGAGLSFAIFFRLLFSFFDGFRETFQLVYSLAFLGRTLYLLGFKSHSSHFFLILSYFLLNDKQIFD